MRKHWLILAMVAAGVVAVLIESYTLAGYSFGFAVGLYYGRITEPRISG